MGSQKAEGTREVKTVAGKSEKFKIGVGVHQGKALSPLLFIAVMEEATRNVVERDSLNCSTLMTWC